jgi:hypothetical protein
MAEFSGADYIGTGANQFQTESSKWYAIGWMV